MNHVLIYTITKKVHLEPIQNGVAGRKLFTRWRRCHERRKQDTNTDSFVLAIMALLWIHPLSLWHSHKDGGFHLSEWSRSAYYYYEVFTTISLPLERRSITAFEPRETDLRRKPRQDSRCNGLIFRKMRHERFSFVRRGCSINCYSASNYRLLQINSISGEY
jgi:hypothetical protein